MSMTQKGKEPTAPAEATHGALARKVLGKRTPLKNVPLLTPAALEELAEKQRQTAAEKKKLTREVRYAKRKRARTMRRVSLLSDEDLAALIEERHCKKHSPEDFMPPEKPKDTEEKMSDVEGAGES